MMKKTVISLVCLSLTSVPFVSCAGRHIRTARDATPGNLVESELDWKYGANDIRIQTTKLSTQLMDRWFCQTGYNIQTCGKPRIIITQVDNRTDTYISSDMIRDIFEGAAVCDERFIVTVGDRCDERELDCLMDKLAYNPKYPYPNDVKPGCATPPQFLAKIRLTKAMTHTPCDDIEDYRMTITLYDIETQEVIDQAYDVLRKRVSI